MDAIQYMSNLLKNQQKWHKKIQLWFLKPDFPSKTKEHNTNQTQIFQEPRNLERPPEGSRPIISGNLNLQFLQSDVSMQTYGPKKEAFIVRFFQLNDKIPRPSLERRLMSQ